MVSSSPRPAGSFSGWMPRIFLACLVTASSAACVGQDPIGENQLCPCAPGWMCDRLQNICVPEGSVVDSGVGGPTSFTATGVQTAQAQCDLPHGPTASPQTYGDKRAFMLGPWIVCPPVDATIFAPGIAFSSDGSWHRYLSDGNGGLVLGYGVQNQGTYAFPSFDAALTNDNPYVTVAAASADFGPNSYADGPLTLETSPDRMHAVITYVDQPIEIWLVRLPGM